MVQISIITATFNAAKTLPCCLESVSNQSLLPEHLIIDGCSTDKTISLVKKYKGHRLRIFSEPDQGLYDAMNKGVERASGEAIGILNADDFYASPYVLERVAQIFEEESIEACYGDLLYVDAEETDKVVRFWKSGVFTHKCFYWGWMPPHPTFFVRKSVYEKYGLFNLNFGSAADYELMLRFLLKHQVKCTYIPEVLVHMRDGGVSNASVANRLAANRNDRKAWEENGLKPYPWTLTMKPLRKLGQWFSKPPRGKN